MKITLSCLAACLIACGQASKSNSKKLRNELLESINQNLEYQNEVLNAVYANSYHQHNLLVKGLYLFENKIENSKNIEQETGKAPQKNTKKIKSNDAINIVELLNNFTKSFSNWTESLTKQISNSQDEASRNIENLTRNISNWQNNTIKTIEERLERLSGCVENKTTETPGEDPIKIPSSCKEVNETESGLYYIRVKAISEKPFQVFCDQTYEGGGWTVFQRRVDSSTNFGLGFQKYKNGFGNLSRNFWMGLKKLHLMTSKKPHELAITMIDYAGNRRFARYSRFVVGSEKENYSLKVLGRYSGNTGNELKKGAKFTTCSKRGGWWSDSCRSSYLNGIYHNGKKCAGVLWISGGFHCRYMKLTQMMIRPI